MVDSNIIVFFYPSMVIGGAEYLFIRLAKYLSSHLKKKVYYIDYKEGFARKKLEDSEVVILDYSDDSKVSIKENVILLTPVSNITTLGNKLDLTPDSRVFFWSIHPTNIISCLPLIQFFIKLKSLNEIILNLFDKEKQNIQKILDQTLNQQALFFMDLENSTYNKILFDLQPDSLKYLPIPIDNKPIHNTRKLLDPNLLSFAWLGRLSEDKIHTLENILWQLNKYCRQEKQKIDFHILGDRKLPDNLKMYSENEFLNLSLKMNLTDETLQNYLTTSIDCLFAMGTSALEGAILKIPTVLVDYSYIPLNKNTQFRWLFETEGFCLGFEASNPLIKPKHSLNEILRSLQDNHNKLADACCNYAVKNHSMDIVINQLLDAANESQFYWKDYLHITAGLKSPSIPEMLKQVVICKLSPKIKFVVIFLFLRYVFLRKLRLIT